MTEAESIRSGRSAPFDPDRTVRLIATDDYQIHRLLYEALATDGVRDFLLRTRDSAPTARTAAGRYA